MKRYRILVCLAAMAALTAVSLPRTASACGGFFCSQQPIDQTAERIIIGVQGETSRVWVQIGFSGNAEDFAWVVPVTAIPEIDVAEAEIFNTLDNLTAPFIVPPPCFQIAFADDVDSDGMGGAEAPPSDQGGVIVYNEADVGPYHTVTVGADDSSVLIAWLNENGYFISPAMYPMVDAYVTGGMYFVAMKLQLGQDADAIQPILMTYDGVATIPLQLTGVAADPNMGVLVWVLGDTRAVSANYAMTELDPDRLRFDGFLRSNYFSLVSQTVDEAGGRAFITEFAGPTENLESFSEPTQAILDSYDYLTRMYMRISPEEMTVDPMFTFNDALGDVDNVIDLSDRADLCDENPNPCDFNYCGPEGTCYEVAGQAACECSEGWVARGVAEPTIGVGVACVPADRDLLEDIVADPCGTYSCGEFGTCVNVNSNPTCACNEGYGAVANSDSTECTSLVGATPDDPTTPGPNNPDTSSDPSLNPSSNTGNDPETGCAVSGGSTPLPGLLLGLAMLGLAVLRRR